MGRIGRGVQAAGPGLPEGPILPVLTETVAALPPRQADVLARRLGIDRPGQTLQEAADDLGITRERVRQVEEEARAALNARTGWPAALGRRVRSRLPLAVADLMGEPWSGGLQPKVARALLRFACGPDANVVRVGDAEWFVGFRVQAWSDLVDRARRSALALGDRAAPAAARDRATHLLGEGDPHGPLLLAAIGWPEGDAGWHRAISPRGPTVPESIDRVMAGAEGPLSLIEVLERIRTLSGHTPTPQAVSEHLRRGHVVDAAGRFAPGPGLPVGEEARRVAESAAAFVRAEVRGRTWRASEVLAALRRRGEAIPDRVDALALDDILAATGVLERRPIGRWVVPGTVTLVDAVRAALEGGGRPVLRADVAYEGWEPPWHTLFPRSNPYAALLPDGSWGLYGRDVPDDPGVRSALGDLASRMVAEKGATSLAQLLDRAVRDGLAAGLPRGRAGTLALGGLLWASPDVMLRRGVVRPALRKRDDSVAALVATVLGGAGADGFEEVEVYARVAEAMGRVPTPVLVRRGLRRHGRRIGGRPARWLPAAGAVDGAISDAGRETSAPTPRT